MRNYNNQIMTNLKLEYDFAELVPVLQGLKVSLWGNYTYGQTKIRNFMNSYEQLVINSTAPGEPTLMRKPGTAEGGSFLKYMQSSDGWMFRPQIDYSRKFGKHDVTALYAYEAQKHSNDECRRRSTNSRQQILSTSISARFSPIKSRVATATPQWCRTLVV